MHRPNYLFSEDKCPSQLTEVNLSFTKHHRNIKRMMNMGIQLGLLIWIICIIIYYRNEVYNRKHTGSHSLSVLRH